MEAWARERFTRAAIIVVFVAAFITGLVEIPNAAFAPVSHQAPVTSPSPRATHRPAVHHPKARHTTKSTPAVKVRTTRTPGPTSSR